MTVIDALVVVLGLDSKDLETKSPAAVKKLNDLDKAADKTEKNVGKISKTSKETARSVQGLSRTVTSFLAIIGGTVAIKSFIQDFIDTNAQLDRLSKNLGISVSTISAWSNASEKLGGSAQGLQGTFDMLSKAQTQLMITGESSLVPYLSALGVSLAGVNGQARPVTDILLDLSERFSHMDRTTANNLGRMLGLDQGTMNLLLQGRKELELEIKRQKEQTAVTAAQAAQAQKFQTQIAGLKQQFSALGRTLLMDAAPYIEKLFRLLENFANWAQQHKQFIEDFLKVIAVGLSAIAIATLPINLTVLAIVALAGALALLWDDYQTWKKGGDSLIDWSKWKPGIDAATWGIHQLNEELKAFVKTAQYLHDLIPDSWASGVQSIAAKLGFRPAQNEIAARGQGTPGGGGATGRLMASLRGGNVSSQALSLAQQVSQQLGIPADLIYAQWQHETGNFTNRGAKDLNNLAGINVPGGKGEDYQKFGSLQDFADSYTSLIKNKYPGAMGAQTADQLASALKAGGYFSDSESNYAGGINRFLTQDKSSYATSMRGIPGAAQLVQNAPAAGGGSTTIDKSVKVDIGTMPIYTQATDAAGLVADMGRALNYLTVSQANYGLQ